MTKRAREIDAKSVVVVVALVAARIFSNEDHRIKFR